MKTTGFLRFGLVLLSLASLVFFIPAQAEDIDIYSDNPRTTDVPNVLLVLDNGANFSASAPNCTYVDGTAPSLNGTTGGIEQCAIYNVVSSLPDKVGDVEGPINIGLMVYNSNNITDKDGANCRGSEGGCLAYPLTRMTVVEKAKFLAWVKSWQTSSAGPGTYWIKANGTATAGAMQESWAYYAGKTGLSGRTYTAPAAGCQKNFLIYIGNAYSSSSSPGDGGSSSPGTNLATQKGLTLNQLNASDQIKIPSGYYGTSAFSCGFYDMTTHTESSGLYADEWAKYMKAYDLYGAYSDTQGITSYTVGLLGPGCKPEYPALLNSMAANGGGKYFATSSYDEISTAILKILNEVQAVNSVFASASLPVSVNAQGTYLNQIFLGMFRPDSSGSPRWLGNLKQYQFILDYLDPNKPDPNTATLRLGDKDGLPALSSAGTGFIASSATSFWTYKDTTQAPDSTGGFFSNDIRGDGKGYDAPDGELVEKGGVAQRIRTDNLTVNYATNPSTPRRLYTYCPAGAGCNPNLTDASNAFATTNSAITDNMLNAVAKTTVSLISRSRAVATVTTATDHGFATGDSVTISGADQSEYNGTKDLITVDTARTFRFSVVDYPPSPATAGIYTASVASASARLALPLTRVGTTVTVTLPLHGFLTGETVTISGADQKRYNGSFPITWVDADHFSYQVVEGPLSPAGSGKATVGNTSVNIEAFNANPNPGIVRPAPNQTGTIDPLLVQVMTATKHNFQAGNSVTISGVKDALGNPLTEYNISATIVSVIGSGGNKIGFTYRIAATTPLSPSTGAITVDRSASIVNIDTLTRAGSTATATVNAGHPFLAGQTVSIASTVPAPNEGAYVTTAQIRSIDPLVSPTKFTYSVVLTPATPATTSSTIQVWKAGVSDRISLINWLRGENNFGDEPNPGFGYTVRQSVHGDVLHSRPAVVNYGDSRGLVVYYGANDGVFRAVNGSQTDNLGAVRPGGEVWGLILPEHYAQLNRQRVNSPEIKMPATVLPSARPKDYFADGAPGSYQQLKADGTIDKAYLYLTMRRGGRFMYALDVSDPLQPKVLWKIDAATTTGFAELGQTWSRPRLTLIKGYTDPSTNLPKPVVVFGAGYDAAAEDMEPPEASTMGRGIFVIDAMTGELVWRGSYTSSGTASCTGSSTRAICGVPGMNWSIPADISFMDRDNDGLTDRFYAADVGGNVWRVDLEAASSGAPDTWQVSKLAALGCASGVCASGSTPRKFFFPPNVVPVGVTGAADAYDVVLLGSGDREHPLADNINPQSSYNVLNRFYSLKDTRTGKAASADMTNYPITESLLFDATASISSTGVVTQNAYTGAGSGFYVSLFGLDKGDATKTPPIPPAAHKGEKVVNAAITVRGTTFFGTNTPIPPSAFSCTSNLGMAKGYALDPFTGKLSSSFYDGGGMPPSPVAGIVSIKLADGTSVDKSFCVGCGGIDGAVGGDKGSALGAGDLSKKVPKKPRRTYWYKR